MKIYRFEGKFLQENSYIIENDGKGIGIDLACNVDMLIDFLAEKHIDLQYILLTHGHFDHIYSIKDLQEKGVKVFGNPITNDIVNSSYNLAKIIGVSCKKFNLDYTFFDGEEIELAGLPIKVIFTPGHSIDGTCYLIKDNLFSGDTLFYHNYGRTDFPSGNEKDLFSSIQNKLFVLDGKTFIYDGHTMPNIIEYHNNYIVCSAITNIDNEKKYLHF